MSNGNIRYRSLIRKKGRGGEQYTRRPKNDSNDKNDNNTNNRKQNEIK